MGRRVKAIILISDTLYLIHIAINFHQDIPYGLHDKSLRNLSK